MAFYETLTTPIVDVDLLLADLSTHAKRAREQAGGTVSKYIVTVSRPLQGGTEWVTGVAGMALGDGPRLFWRAPDSGGVCLTHDVAAIHFGHGSDRISAVKSGFDAYTVWQTGSAVDVRWYGGVSFDTGDRTAPWSTWPDALFFLPRVTISCERGEWHVAACAVVDQEADVDYLVRTVRGSLLQLLHAASNASRTVRVQRDRWTRVTNISKPSRVEYQRIVTETAKAIREERFRKVVLARRETIRGDAPVDVADVLSRLQHRFPTSYVFVLWHGVQAFIGASPEQLVRVEGDEVRIDSLAGTTGRGGTPEEDQQFASELLNSAKDRHEHAVVLHWIQHQIAPLVTNIRAAEVPAVKKLRNVQHLHTPIRARRRSGVTALDLMERLHPTPAVAGEPRDKVFPYIRSMEGIDRGWYAGAIGWLTPSGDGEFCVALRSALVDGDTAHLFAGVGVMGDSDPVSEWKESQMKLRAIELALMPREEVEQ